MDNISASDSTVWCQKEAAQKIVITVTHQFPSGKFPLSLQVCVLSCVTVCFCRRWVNFCQLFCVEWPMISLQPPFIHFKPHMLSKSILKPICFSLSFTARCTIVQSTVLRLLVVCLSVMLVDHDHVGWKSWKLIVRTISPKAIHLLQGRNMGEKMFVQHLRP